MVYAVRVMTWRVGVCGRCEVVMWHAGGDVGPCGGRGTCDVAVCRPVDAARVMARCSAR